MSSELRADLLELFGRGVDAPLAEERFDELALRAFRHQLERNPVYAAYCRSRGVEPDRVGSWHEIPLVPTRAFKELPLVSGDPQEAERVFRTSGTTAGARRRGEHHVLDLALYDASLLPNLRAHLLPDRERIRILALVPDPARVPDSSLGYMVGRAVEEMGAEGSGFFVRPDGSMDEEAFRRALGRAVEEDTPVLLAATAFALVHWLDRTGERGGIRLPEGSRIMETGGFKGRSRTVPREELYRDAERLLGVPSGRIVNEYGMTELLSQFYEPVIRRPGETRRLLPPPWVRTRVMDPVELEPVPEGTVGILSHFDLANVGSVCHVLTEDQGFAVRGGFRVLGRAPGAEPRGCSLAMEHLLAAEEGHG